jgi:hypothetical protein
MQGYEIQKNIEQQKTYEIIIGQDQHQVLFCWPIRFK